VSTSGSRTKLIDYIDHLAETAGDPKIWLKITTAFRLSQDPGASFALASSLEAAMAMADNLGFGGLAHVTKARPIIQAVSAALLEVPEQTRLKLANAQFATHRCSGSPSEFPLLCCFTTEISDQTIVSRIVALRSFVLLGVMFETDRSAQLKVVADGLRKAQSLPHPWADLVRHLPDPEHAPERWLSAALSRAEEHRMELEHARRHGPAQIAFLTALIGLIRDFGRLIEPSRHRARVAPSIPTAGVGVILKRRKERDADERVSRSSTKRAVPKVNTLLKFDPEDATVAEPVQHELDGPTHQRSRSTKKQNDGFGPGAEPSSSGLAKVARKDVTDFARSSKQFRPLAYPGLRARADRLHQLPCRDRRRS